MARIFSWHIKDENKECFSYLATSGLSGNYSAGYMVLEDKISESAKLTSIANVVSAYTENVYKTQFNNMKQAVADCGFTVTWKNYRDYYDVDGSNLVMLTGVGEKGEQGLQGIQGEKGETGASGKGRNIMCYCGLDSGITPTRANVTGGKFYPNRWDVEYPTDPNHICTWQDSNEFGPNKVVWMTNADFPNSTGSSPSEAVTPIVKSDGHGGTYTWSTPIRISGPKGDNGADGESVEFVYKRAHKRTDPIPSKPTGTTEQQAEQQGWTDHPLGVVGDSDNPNENWRVEYISQHIKDPQTGQWGEFTNPVLWASWGEDGNDGDGIEYIFAITQNYTAPGNVPNRDMKLALTNGGELKLSDIWQEPEICDYFTYCGVTKTNDGVTVDPDGRYFYGKTGRTDTRHASIYPWTDDPMDVSSGEPYEWVCIRRSKWDESQEHSVYGDFTGPILWAHWGRDGERGNDGTSVDIRGQADTLGHLLKGLGNNVPEVGFSYAIGSDGKRVYVWMEQDSNFNVGRLPYSAGTMGNAWYEKTDSDIYENYYYRKNNKNYWFTDCGSFYGEPGENAYLHIKYATDYTGQTGLDHVVTTINGVDGTRDICFTSGATLGEAPGRYIATYTDNLPDDRGDLAYYTGKWSKFEGDDGQSYGQEQIFFRSASLINVNQYVRTATADEHGYEIGEKYLDVDYTGSFDKTDWVPSNWTDVPMGIINGIYNFEYVSVRRLLDDGTWSYFSEPALYNEASDTTEFQVEYSTWTGETTPVLRNASEFTNANGEFNENAWRAAHSSTGPWTDSNTTNTVWMATAQRINRNSNSATTTWNDWQITRCKGINGKAGNGRAIMCYCSLPPEYKPTIANVSGGAFYPNSWDITYPTDPIGITPTGKPKKYCAWQDSNEPADPSYMVWMTTADFPSSTGTSAGEVVTPIVKTDDQQHTYTWSEPICITGEKGENGENGVDGDSIEFIYFRTSDGTIVPDTPLETSQEPDFCPEAYINGVDTGEKWTDHPMGISETWRAEWMCQRKKTDDGIWGRFSQAVPWARWGEDGIDGDGVEYIFATASTLNAAQTLFTKVPKSTDTRLRDHWQDPEIWDYIRDNNYQSFYSPWTDDPSDVSPNEPYEFVSIRRRQYDSVVGNAIFHEFEEPTLWARWSDDGDSIFTSFSFATLSAGTDISNCVVSGYTTGTSINPKWTKSGNTLVSGVVWSDTPSQQNSTQVIWMVSGVFKKHTNPKTGVVTYSQEQPWSNIQQMVDTADFEVIYSPKENPENPNTVPNFKKNGITINPTWLAAANQKGWFDEVSDIPSVSGDPIWMATIKGHSNIWDKDASQKDNWQIMKVKGEKGNKGDSGATGVSKFKSIVFKRTNATPSTPTGGSYASPLPNPLSGWTDTIPQGDEILWMSSRMFSSDGNNEASWCAPSKCTDTEYIDYEWTNWSGYTTLAQAIAHPPLKSSPNQSLTPSQNNHWNGNPISGAVFMAVRQVENGAYVGNWTVSQVKGEKGADGTYPHDLDYLKDVFPNVEASANTATLRGFLGVVSGSSQNNVVAFINGSGATQFHDNEHGTLMMAAGVEGGLQYAKDAKFMVYEDGAMFAKNGTFEGTVQASTVTASDGVNGFELNSDGAVNITNKNFTLNNHGIYFKNNDDNNVLSVVADKVYHSLNDFVSSMTGGSETLYGNREEILQEVSYEQSTTAIISYATPDYTTISNTTFTVPNGNTNRVTIRINNSLVFAAIIPGQSGLGFGSAFINYKVRIVLADANNNSVGEICDFSGTTNSASKVLAQSITKTFTVGPGEYHLQLLSSYIMGTATLNGTPPQTGYNWKLVLDLNNIGAQSPLIESIPSMSGTEIYRNGFCVKNGTRNYLFVAAPESGGPDNLIFAIMSGGSGKCFSGGTWTDITA